MDDLEKMLNDDTSTPKRTFIGTGVPGKPSNQYLFAEPKQESIAKKLLDEDKKKLLTTEAEVLYARARKKEKEAMEGR